MNMFPRSQINDKNVGRRRLLALPLALLVCLVIFSGESKAQLIIDSINYKIDVGDFSGLPGTIVRMPVQIKNAIPVGGFLIRFTYPKSLLTPIRIAEAGGGLSIVYDSLEMVGRGRSTIIFDTLGVPSTWDTTYTVFAPRDTVDTVINGNAIFVQFLPPLPPDPPPPGYVRPQIAAKTDTVGVILNFLFRVSSSATTGQTAFIQVEDYKGTLPEYRINQFSDTSGTITIYPGTGTYGFGRFTVGTPPVDPCPTDTCPDTCCTAGPPGNNAPSVGAIVPSSYTINQGDSVRFTVTATDPDGDDLTLRANGLPANAQFLPSNPVSGTANVSGTFRFVPSFAQEGTFIIDFQAADEFNANSAIRSVSITVNKLDIDRLFTTSTYGGAPVGGVPGASPVVLPIDLVTSKTVYGIQFDMTYPGQVAEIDSIVVTDRTPDYVVYENIGQFPDTVRVVAFGLANEPIVDGTSSAILRAYMSIDSASTPGDYWVKFYDAWESIDPNPQVPSLFLLTDSGIIEVDRYGDVNLDKKINVADLVNIVAYILGNYGLPPRNFATANVVRDAFVNVVDLVGVVNTIFGLPINPSPAPVNYEGQVASLRLVHDNLSAGQLTKLNVQGEFPDNVAGVQLQIDYDPTSVEFNRPELAEMASQFILAYNDDHSGRIRMVLYSNQPWKEETLIPSGISDFMRIPAVVKKDISADDKSTMRITQVYLSNANANEIPVDNPNPILPTNFMLYQNYPNPFNPVTRIDFDISKAGGEYARLKIYNILGQHVKTLVDRHLETGRHTVTWDASDQNGRPVATGIYLYRLEVGDKHQTKKMVLLK